MACGLHSWQRPVAAIISAKTDDTAQLLTLISCTALLTQRSTSVTNSAMPSPAAVIAVSGACSSQAPTITAMLMGSKAVDVVI